MDALIREGLPMDYASQVQARLALTDQGFADTLAVGDRLFRLARIVSLATEVL